MFTMLSTRLGDPARRAGGVARPRGGGGGDDQTGSGGGSSLVPAGGTGPVVSFDPVHVTIRDAKQRVCDGTKATLAGTARDDDLVGTRGRDVTRAGDGDDNASAGGGDDLACGAVDGDTVNGGAGDDTANGGPGDDTANGGPGNETIAGGAGNDTIRARDAKADRINCGTGDDTAVLDPSDAIITATPQNSNGSCDQQFTATRDAAAKRRAPPRTARRLERAEPVKVGSAEGNQTSRLRRAAQAPPADPTVNRNSMRSRIAQTKRECTRLSSDRRG
jgi:Ca2+-binding RTX toxin-like protein